MGTLGKLLVLFAGFEVTTALEDKKGLTGLSAKPVVDCITVCFEFVSSILMFGNTADDYMVLHCNLLIQFLFYVLHFILKRLCIKLHRIGGMEIRNAGQGRLQIHIASRKASQEREPKASNSPRSCCVILGSKLPKTERPRGLPVPLTAVCLTQSISAILPSRNQIQ